ncbi:MAG: type II secretion system protein [Phycisphaerales bacterium]
MQTRRHIRAAFTLLEGLLSIVVIAIIAALTLPVVNGATDNFAEASSARRATENVAFAMERTVRLLRDAPPGTTINTLDITSASQDALVFGNGSSIALQSGQLMLTTDTAAGAGVLLSGVQTFQLQYLGEDGVTSTLTAPATTQRFVITIRAGNAELRCVAFPRVRMVPQ